MDLTPPQPVADVDELEITIVADNLTDIFQPDAGPARRSRLADLPTSPSVLTQSGLVFDPLVAEHGFGALVTVRRHDEQHTMLFDAGGSPRGAVENMRRLAIDISAISAIVLSHNHFDHTAGLDGLVHVLGSDLPAYLHPQFWHQRRISLPGQGPTPMHSPSRDALRDAGFSLSETASPRVLFAGAGLLTGEVPRMTDFELGLPHQEALIDGRWEPDAATIDEQALVFNVRGRGLVVIVGCSHPGVINTVRAAQRLTGVSRVHAVVGGFHLNGPTFEPLIPRTVQALKDLSPDWLVPSHCTGWRAHAALAHAFPLNAMPGAVGTRLRFGAADRPGRR